MKSYKLILRFSKYLKPYWGKEIVLFILMIFSSAGTLVSPYILKIIIDDVFPASDFSLLIKVITILVFVNILRLIIDFFVEYLYTFIGSNITRDLRNDVFNKVMKLPMRFLNKNKIGDITHRINDEVNAVEGILTGVFIRFTQDIFTLIGLSIALSLLNFKLFIISMLVLPIIIINIRYYEPRIRKNVTKQREKYSDILGYLVERISNIKTIKIFNSYALEGKTIQDKLNDLIKLRLKITIQSSITRNIATFLIALSPLAVFLIGGKHVLEGAMTLGALIAFIQYLNRIFNPLRSLIRLYWELVHSTVSLKRVFEFMEEETEDFSDSKSINRINTIEFKSVKFNYDGKEVLNGVDLKLEKGKKYAIVGSSGCGKSTLVNLLCRFYEPHGGTIYANEVDIKTVNLAEYRQLFSFVPQDGQFFNDTLYNNLTYGTPNANKEIVSELFNNLELDSSANNEKITFESIIGDNATILSGGQKQKIAIGRAIIKNSEVIIFDEATSALDSINEKKLIDLLFQNSEDKIILIISHRVSAIKNVDTILCMRDGVIIESGNYDELIERNGVYSDLFNEQIQGKPQ